MKKNILFYKYKLDYASVVNREKKPDEIALGYQVKADGFTYGICKMNELEKLINNYTENKRYFYEMIREQIPVRGYWDVDMYPDKFTPEESHSTINIILETIKLEISRIYNHYADLMVFTSSTIGEKYSYHIITRNLHFKTMAEVLAFTKHVVNMLKEEINIKVASTIDLGVYTANRLFRILGNNKYGSQRTKTIDTILTREWCSNQEKIMIKETLVTNLMDTISIPDILMKPENPTKKNNYLTISKQLKEKLTEIVSNYYKLRGLEWKHKFRRTRGNCLYYDRQKTEECLICDQGHIRDNTVYIQYMYRGEVYLRCIRNSEKKILIGKIPTKETVKITHQPFIECITKKLNMPETSLFDSLPDYCKNIYIDDHMHDYENVKTLCVKAPMGLGKTVKLIEDIGKYEYNYIIMVSFRKTFTAEAKRRFSTFETYDRLTGRIDIRKHPRLIIQTESLHRICGPELRTVDGQMLVILDESESIFAQFNHTSAENNDQLSFAAFQAILSRANKVIAMDANMSDRTYNVLNKYRKDSIFYHHNEYKNKSDYSCLVTNNKSDWTTKLMSDIQTNKIAIVSNSCEYAETLYEMITTKLKAMPATDGAKVPQVLLMTGKMLNRDRQIIFHNVNESWKNYDIIIYTPTVTAGVSFEVEHFDKLYGYFSDESCDGLTCDQMLGRIRNLHKKEYNICISSRRKHLPDTPGEIKEYLIHSREETLQMVPETKKLPVHIDEMGKFVYRIDDYAELWLENAAVRNQYKNNFAEKFIRIMKNKGCTLYELALPGSEIINKVTKKDMDKSKKVAKEKEAELKSSSAPPLDTNGKLLPVEYYVTEEMRAGARRYQLGQIYYIETEKITKEFVLNYDNRKTIRHYINSVQAIDGLEKAATRYIRNLTSLSNTMDELRGNRVDNLEKQKIAHKLLCSTGFTGIDDKQKRSKKSALENLGKHKDLYTVAEINNYNDIFGICVDQNKQHIITLNQHMNIVNGVLNYMYGIEIVSIDRSSNARDTETGMKKRDILIIKRNKLLEELKKNQMHATEMEEIDKVSKKPISPNLPPGYIMETIAEGLVIEESEETIKIDIEE